MKLNEKKQRWIKRINEINDKNLIDDQQTETLSLMVKSADPENFTVAEECIKTLIRSRLILGLNQDQSVAFEEIVNFLENPQNSAIILKGYAGTGKTYLVKKILEYITYTTDNKSIGISAPTNKAVGVLYNSSLQSGMNGYIFEDIFDMKKSIVYSTIHKMLGLKEVITDNGDQLFMLDTFNKSNLLKYDYLVVDEVSMLDDKICHDIMKFSKKLKIIFMGDPAQIPPVNKLDSIPFQKNSPYDFKTVELKQIMRQKGDHPVVDLSFKIRENLFRKQPLPVLNTELNSNGNGIIFIDSQTEKSKIKGLLKEYFICDNYKNNSDYFKVIAWKNKTINYINNVARELMYGENHESNPYFPGESLIVMKPIFKYNIDTGTYQIVFNTSEDLKVLDVKIVDQLFHINNHWVTLKGYELKVNAYNPKNPEKPYTNTIFVVHKDSLKEYENVLKMTKDYAKKTKDSKEWAKYYTVLKWSANVAYSYAITAHKSQGSTYKNALILEEDIDQNNKTLERNRIKYTVYSRVTDKLFVLRNNYPSLVYSSNKN
jgi:DNA replication protein DnaC